MVLFFPKLLAINLKGKESMKLVFILSNSFVVIFTFAIQGFLVKFIESNLTKILIDLEFLEYFIKLYLLVQLLFINCINYLNYLNNLIVSA